VHDGTSPAAVNACTLLASYLDLPIHHTLDIKQKKAIKAQSSKYSNTMFKYPNKRLSLAKVLADPLIQALIREI